jgi:hypothetical protein
VALLASLLVDAGHANYWEAAKILDVGGIDGFFCVESGDIRQSGVGEGRVLHETRSKRRMRC